MRSLSFVTALFLVLLPSPASTQETHISIEGEVPVGGETHFFLPFEVPDGVVEVEVRHDDLSDANILDWGLDDPNGFRGWGGGNTEPAIVGVDAASRSYVPGPIPTGQWEVVVGKAKVIERPARYAVEVFLRTTPTLPAQSERRPYVPPPALDDGPRWYAGDFHVHSRESGDARPSIGEALELAESRGLDFILLSEHNTNSQLTLYGQAQDDQPNVLLLPGVEFTTYGGHANGIGTVEWVDHRIGVRGATIEDAIRHIHDQGALISINHPQLRVGDLCIGCGWDHAVDPVDIDGVEIQTGVFPGLEFWEDLVAQGSRAAAIGGSDDHRAGSDLGVFDSPIGTPTTMVFADELSVQGILQGVRDGRTVVKILGPDAPMIDSELTGRRNGDTVSAIQSTLRATVTSGQGTTLRLIKNGQIFEEVEVDADPFEYEIDVEAPLTGEDRYRHEIANGNTRLTVASYVWLRRAEGGSGDGCALTPTGNAPALPWLPLVALLGAARACRRNEGKGTRQSNRASSGPQR